MKQTLLFICSFLVYNTVLAGSNIFYGLNYGVNRNDCPSLEAVKNDFRILSQYTNIVRIYSIKDCNLGELALKASQASRMRLYLGMWIDNTDAFDQELAALKTIVNKNRFYNVEAIIVGSEVMYRGDIPSEKLVDHINEVKSLVGPKGVQVTTSDVYYKIYPNVVEAVDFVMMNAFTYYEGVPVNSAAETLREHFVSATELSNGKPVRISESGWPAHGEAFKESVPSPEAQKEYLLESLCMAQKNNIDLIWFSAFDEPYKSEGAEGHFGLLDSNRQLKSNFKLEELSNPCSAS